jgi:hypothetical protein
MNKILTLISILFFYYLIYNNLNDKVKPGNCIELNGSKYRIITEDYQYYTAVKVGSSISGFILKEYVKDVKKINCNPVVFALE